MITYKYVSAYCGAGKTHLLSNTCLKMIERSPRAKIAIVQPTTDLVEQTHRAYFAQHKRARMITSLTNPNAVISTLQEHLEQADPDSPEVLLITHSAFLAMRHWHNAQAWTLFVDEVPPVEQYFSLKLPRSHPILTGKLAVVDKTSMEQFWEIAPSSSEIEEMALNRADDELWQPLSPLARTLVSPRYQTYVHARSYEALVNARPDAPGQSSLSASSILLPTTFGGFNDVVFWGACFEDSLMYLMWTRMRDPNLRVEFVDASKEFEQFGKLRYDAHPNGHLLDIHYGLDVPWSKRVRDLIVTHADGSRGTVYDAFDKARSALFGAEKAAFHINNDIAKLVPAASERLPNTSHGLNQFQHLHNAFLVSALNPPPQHFSFLDCFADIGADELQTALTRQSVYQAACRISLRNPADQNRKKLIVPDLKTAEYLGAIFEHATLHCLKLFDDADAETRTLLHPNRWRESLYDDKAHKQRAHNERNRLKERERLARHFRLDAITDRSRAFGFPVKVIGTREQTKIKTEVISTGMMATQMHNKALHSSEFVRGFQGSMFLEGAFDNDAQPLEMAFDGLVALLREAAATKTNDKRTLPALSPCLFVPDNGLTDKRRGNANIAFAKNIMLDFDGGDLPPEEFAMIFTAWRMVIYSTWSSTPDAKRWRVLIETDDVVDFDSYKVLTSYILGRLNDEGYFSEKQVVEDPTIRRRASRAFKGLHGCDASKLTPSCILFMPSERPDSFLMDYSREHGRVPLSVYEVVVTAPVELPSDHAVAEATRTPKPVGPRSSKAKKARSVPKADRIQAAIDEWHRAGDLEGKRHDGFFALGRNLMNAGLDRAAISLEMSKAATASRARPELISRIEDILSNLRPFS